MLNYQIATLSVPFDRDYRNVFRFESVDAQEQYFDVDTLFSNAKSVNFRAGNLQSTQVVYQMGENESLTDMLNKNYCIIKDNNSNATKTYLYFFIIDAVQNSANQIVLTLQCDIFQTYYLGIEFTDCNISKAHLNRFVENADASISFDGTPTSKLFEREEITNVSKRLTSREEVSPYHNLPNMTDEVEEWLLENIQGWCYVFIDPTHSYTYTSKTGGSVTTWTPDKLWIKSKNGQRVNSGISVLCYPVCGVNAFHVDVGDDYSYIITPPSYDYFADQNNGDAYVIAKKISRIPPFMTTLTSNVTWTLNSSKTILTMGGGTSSGNVGYFSQDGSSSSPYRLFVQAMNADQSGSVPLLYCMFLMTMQEQEIEVPYTLKNSQMTFDRVDIIGADKNTKFNPKLLGIDFKGVAVGTETEVFEYDIQKLNKNSLELLVSEPIAPDITKTYVRYIGDDSDIFITETANNFTGSVTSNDTSMVLVTSNIQEYMAYNKNYFLQNTVNRVSTAFTTMTNASMSAMQGNMSGTVTSLLSAGTSYVTSVIQQNLSVDNMRNAPADIQNAKGNVWLYLMTSGIGLYVEEYDILENEKEIINDYMCQYGFTCNLVGNIKDYDNVRKYYNYVRAEIQETTGEAISIGVHDAFKSAFSRGVRFWNVIDNETPSLSYDKENYENWLEE